MNEQEYKEYVEATLQEFTESEGKTRGSDDLSALEEYLLERLYYEQKVVENLISYNEENDS